MIPSVNFVYNNNNSNKKNYFNINMIDMNIN